LPSIPAFLRGRVDPEFSGIRAGVVRDFPVIFLRTGDIPTDTASSLKPELVKSNAVT
jgi:hypothetical protein